MTKELESLCERLIQKHKEGNGTLIWHKNIFETPSNTTPAREILLERGLIKWVTSLRRTTVLTENGWKFESFEKERQKPNPELEKLELEIQALRRQFFDYNKNKWQAKWALIIATAAAIAAIMQLFV